MDLSYNMLCLLLLTAPPAFAQAAPSGGPPDGRQALAAGDFVRAKAIYREYVQAYPNSLPGELGLADAELGLREYEAAELQYRAVTAQQPQLWIAHKNLVLIEAALGRWDEFDRERALLKSARERRAPGISARESDVIDSFTVHGRRWIVREYFEPVGRSKTRYNFEHFSPDGKAEEYISLESEQAAKAAIAGADVAIGSEPTTSVDGPAKTLSLSWYTGKAHGTIKRYLANEPSYEVVRAAVLQWLRIQPH